MKKLFLFLFLIIFLIPGYSIEYGLDLGIGTEVFTEDGQSVAYNVISFGPDLSIGNFGIGLDLKFHYRFADNEEEPGSSFTLRKQTWIPDEDTNILELYLPKIKYVRYGHKGDDIYVKLGMLEDASLGNGFIMWNYSNAIFAPERRHFGMNLDIDGNLFGVPLIGFESVLGNFAAMDVLGSRFYVRPLSPLEIPLFELLEIGLNVVTDFKPAYHSDDETFEPDTALFVYGLDVFQPILANPIVTLAVFGDLVFQQNKTYGAMLGFGGRLISFLPYSAQLRFMGENFIPSVFNSSYDIRRKQIYNVITSETEQIPSSVGWFASLGTSLFDDMLIFNASLEGSFGSDSGPNLTSVLQIADGLIPVSNIYMDAIYEKRDISSFSDLIDPADALIMANINYKTGPAVITLTHKLIYLGADAEGASIWETSTSLTTSISFF